MNETVEANAQIVLSKTTFASATPLPLSKRIAWLRYEIPSSINPVNVVPKAAFLNLMALITLVALAVHFGETFPQILVHPASLLLACTIVFGSWLYFAALVMAFTIAYCINPKEFLNLFVFPDILDLKDNMLELRWTKAVKGSMLPGRLRIAWDWISSVKMKEYLYMGVLPQTVLEIELNRIPTDRAEWDKLQKLSRDGCYFLDPSTNKLAKRFGLSGIRLPVALFPFHTDVQLLIDCISQKCVRR